MLKYSRPGKDSKNSAKTIRNYNYPPSKGIQRLTVDSGGLFELDLTEEANMAEAAAEAAAHTAQGAGTTNHTKV
jgi:hypothetical protein